MRAGMTGKSAVAEAGGGSDPRQEPRVTAGKVGGSCQRYPPAPTALDSISTARFS
jgi:hypothetical protein